MTQKKIKLNLGCGVVYRPGYLNIDKFNNLVADKICNADDLTFKLNSVDTIEAFHLIEHFDYIYSKYVLSEWFRVLKPAGILIIETPNLEESFKKFKFSNLENKKTTLQWIYGIDSPGMQHKTGFTFGLIKSLLEEIGFEKISKEKPRTHQYEPGMRILCWKPENFLNKQLFACFRKRLKKELKVDDSYILIPLENWINKIFGIYSEEFTKNKKNCVNKIISKASICNPLMPQIFLEECVNFGFVKKDEINNDLMNYLVEIEFHKKLFSLWLKRRKRKNEIGEIFENFIKDLELIITQCLIDKNYKERLSYIEELNSADIKIFDSQIIQLKARELFNQGVKEFHNRNFSKAFNLFLKSVKINPVNPLSYWNVARLKIILNYNVAEIAEDYKNILSLTKDKNTQKKLTLELNNVINKGSNSVPQMPILEDYQGNIL